MLRIPTHSRNLRNIIIKDLIALRSYEILDITFLSADKLNVVFNFCAVLLYFKVIKHLNTQNSLRWGMGVGMMGTGARGQ